MVLCRLGFGALTEATATADPLLLEAATLGGFVEVQLLLSLGRAEALVAAFQLTLRETHSMNSFGATSVVAPKFCCQRSRCEPSRQQLTAPPYSSSAAWVELLAESATISIGSTHGILELICSATFAWSRPGRFASPLISLSRRCITETLFLRVLASICSVLHTPTPNVSPKS